MNRQEKAQLVDYLTDGLSKSYATVVMGYKGLNVVQMQTLRNMLRSQGSTFKITKARLMKRAVDEVPQTHGLMPYLKDQIGLVLIPKDFTGTLKILYDFSKDNEALTFIIGCSEDRVLTKEMLTRLATLPSREILLVQLCGMLKGPFAKLANVLEQVKEKKQ